MTSTNDARKQILENLQASKPLRPHWIRALSVMLPWAIFFGFAVCLGTGLRPDFSDLGPWITWCASGGFLVLAFIGIVLALRDSTPGQRLPLSIWWISIATALAARAALAHWVHNHSSNLTPMNGASAAMLACAGTISVLGFALLIGLVALSRRGLIRSSWAAFSSVSVVLGAEAIWRLHCPYTDPVHFFSGHFSPILILAMVTALAINFLNRSRRTRSAR